MGDPISMLAIGSIVAGTAGAATSFAGATTSADAAQMQMQANASNAAYQAQVASNNATIAGRNANMDLQSGETAELNRGLKTRAQVGTTLAGQSGSGVNVNTGSFVGARAAESEIGALDALTIRSNTAKKVYADQTQQSDYEAQSGLLTQEAGQATSAAPVAYEGAILSGTGSLLSNASSVSSSAYKFMQTGGSAAGPGFVSGL